MSVSLKIYHQLPPWARTFVASMRGHYLNRWRYDSQTEKLVAETLDRDYWSPKQWQEWQEARLSYILQRAVTKVPFYREQWAERRRNGDKSSWEYLENWQPLEKQTLRDRKTEFVADDCKISKMYRDNTSGTTGKSLDIWLTHSTVKHWYAMFEARWRRWYGVSRYNRWAILGGQLVTPFSQEKPPFWVWNNGLNQLYMSAYHLSPELTKYYLEALVKYRIEYVFGYSAALYSLAQGALRNNVKDIKFKVAITNAEPLYEYQRTAIETAFDCPVRETYGMAEMVAAAGECEYDNLHQWSDAGIIEKTSDYKNTQSMDFICTGLVNADMPLVRYRVGDSGTLSDETCQCKRTLPLLKKVEGRTDDILFTKDGRRIGRLDPVFKNNLHVTEVQIIQLSLNCLNIKYVPTSNFNQKSAKQLIDNIKDRMGDIEVSLEEVINIPRTERGKFRAVICNLSAAERSKISVQ